MGLRDRIRNFFLKEEEENQNQRMMEDEYDFATMAEKIDKGKANLWDLIENKDELSSYSSIMQREIIRDAIQNTDFNQLDAGGKSVFHKIAADNSLVASMMVDELRLAGKYGALLNTMDADGNTPIRDMVANHGFVIKDNDFENNPSLEYGEQLDNEISHTNTHSATVEDDHDIDVGKAGAYLGAIGSFLSSLKGDRDLDNDNYDDKGKDADADNEFDDGGAEFDDPGIDL